MAFLQPAVQLELTKSFQDHFDVLLMFDRIAGIDENVIQIYDDKLVSIVSENVIHHMLKYGGCICKSDRHDQTFKVSESGQTLAEEENDS